MKPRKPIRTKAHSPFAKNLKAVLAERGVSQKVAAELAGVTPATLNDWLGGTQPSDSIAVQRLCRALKADFEWILTGEKSRIEGKDLSLSELFEIQDDPAFSGIFMIEAKRLKKRISE
ncbi:helix-turn-helix transcriptional regulator [Bdellovibrionota bacterium FG-2]